MPALLHARPPTDPAEERRLRKLAAARHAPASWIQRARIITGSWDGASVAELARRLDCHPKTVYKWLHRFNTSGIDGLADLPRPGVPRRISEHQRGRIIALARSAPPGRLHQGGEGLLAPDQPEAPAHWTLDALALAAQAEGIAIGRSQVRRILLAERVPWRITEYERGRIIQLARTEPPGRLQQGGEGLLAPDQPEAPAHWTLDTLAAAAQAEGIQVGRSQVRRILLSERVRWRHTRSWATSTDPDFVPKGHRSSPATRSRPRRRRCISP